MTVIFILQSQDFRGAVFPGIAADFTFLNPALAPAAVITLDSSQFGSIPTHPISLAAHFVGSIGVNGIVVFGNFIRANLWQVANWAAEDSITLRANLTGSTVIQGTGFADKVIGGSGSDELNGGGGADTIIGGGGADSLFGGSGLDTASYTGRLGVTVNLTTGTATGGDQLSGIENVIGSSLADRITGDALHNGLQGGNGDDTLVGGGGIDRLTGGLGADHFTYLTLADAPFGRSTDLITDFNRRVGDLIDLSAIDANGRLSGDAFDFVGKALFSHKAGELRTFTIANATFVEGDVTGDGVADLRIKLTGVFAVQDTDFVL